MNLAVSADTRVMRLAHPVRCLAAYPASLTHLEHMMGSGTWAALGAAFRANERRFTGDIVHELCSNPQHSGLARFVEVSSGIAGGTELGNAYVNLLHVRSQLAPQPHFLIDEPLLALLEQTDIAPDMPVEYLNLPFPRCFVELGTTRNIPQKVPNTLTGLHILEGAYFESGVHPQVGEGIYVMMVGSPLGKENALDDASHAVFLPKSPGRTLEQALAWSFQTSKEMALETGMFVSPAEFEAMAMHCLLCLAKVLLYIGLPEARKELKRDRTEQEKLLEAKKSPAKRAKAERRGAHLVDHILVSAPPVRPEALGGGAGTTHTKAHWRRGHYRLQPHGSGNTQRTMIFISPKLVSFHRTDVPAPQYKVV
jgi:hypothetical protein